MNRADGSEADKSAYQTDKQRSSHLTPESARNDDGTESHQTLESEDDFTDDHESSQSAYDHKGSEAF